MLKKIIKYYSLSEIRYYHKSLKLEIKYQKKILQEIEN